MSTSSAEASARLHARLHAVLAAAASANNGNPTAAATMAAAMAASTAAAASASTTTTAAPSRSSTTSSSSATTTDKDKKKKDQNEEEDDEEDITYTPYKPAKLKYGKPHPDKVVENATLAAVAPPDITYNMVMPANIIYEGKLSNLQLEAIVYGCQRHMVDLPKAKISNEENNTPVAVGGSSAAVKSEKKMGAVKSEKKVGLSYQQQQQQVKHEAKPQADSPALSPCPPSSSGIGDGSGSTPVGAAKKMEPPSYRAGFLLGDGAGMVSLPFF